MKHIFIVNPAAGRSDKSREISDFVSSNNINAEVYTTKYAGDAAAYVKEWCGAHPDEPVRFYACGGDGTLNEVASGVVSFPQASISAYPCGSGNDYVKYYGGAEAFLDIKALMEGEEVPVDLMKIGDRYCINVCNFGFDAKVAKVMIKVKRKKIIGGKNAYYTGVVAALINAMRNRCKVTVDGERIGGKDVMLLCTVSNGSYVGGSFKCAPRSLNDDGLLEVCYVKPLSRLKFVQLVALYQAGEHLDSAKFKEIILYRRGKKVDIEAPEGFLLCIDGDIIEGTDFTIEAMNKAIKFAVPKGAKLHNPKEAK